MRHGCVWCHKVYEAFLRNNIKMWVFYLLAFAWPDLYTKCFPASANEQIMAQTGVYDSTLVAEDGTVACSEGILVVGTDVGRKRGNCQTWTSRSGTAVKINFPYQIVCSEGTSSKWKYAAAGLDKIVYDPFAADDDEPHDAVQSTPVLIAGNGAGAWAAAAAIRVRHPDLDITVVAPPGASTTARSTGVLWFPDPLVHTPERLKQATGGGSIDEAWLEEYVREGAKSYTFWKDRLQLVPYSAFGNPQLLAKDYTLYDGEIPVSRSFTYNNLDRYGGPHLIQTLKAIAQPTKEVAGTLAHVARNRAAVTSDTGNVTIYFSAIVFGTGGNGHAHPDYSGVTLADPFNTGIHVHAARDNNIELTDEYFWHLEFSKNTGAPEYTARWFAFDQCTAANASNYPSCDDYSSRSQSIEPGVAMQMQNISVCPQASTYAYWNIIAAGVPNVPCRDQCDQCMLRSGIIDSKQSFRSMTPTYKHTDFNFFLSGTSAAAPLKNAYFGPGATLGFALHTGRMIAEDSAFNFEFEKNLLPSGPAVYYIVGSWLILSGILTHAAAPYLALWARNLHYVLQPAGTSLITYGVAISKGRMKSVNSVHFYAGYTTLGLLWLATVAGVYVKYTSVTRGRNITLGNAHALFGIVAASLIAYLYISAYQRPSVLYLYEHQYSETAAYIWAGLLAATVLLIAKDRLFPASEDKRTVFNPYAAI